MTRIKFENVKKEADIAVKEIYRKVDNKFTDMEHNIQNKIKDVNSRFSKFEDLPDRFQKFLKEIENVKKEVDFAVKEIDEKVENKLTDMENNIQNIIEDVNSRLSNFEDLPDRLQKIIKQMGIVKKEVDIELKEIGKKVDNKFTDMENNIQNKIEDVNSRFSKFEDLPDRLQEIIKQIGHVEGDVRSTRKNAEKIFAASNKSIIQGEYKLKQLHKTLDTLDHELNITTGNLNRTREIQDLIHKNTFDKGSLIIVMLIIIIGLAALGVYVCVYKPWQPKHFSQSYASEAQQALSAVPTRPFLGSNVCIISFKSSRSAEYQSLVRSALSSSGYADIMHEITKHTDISRLPHCKMYIMCVEFSERHVIIEETGLGLGDMKRTTYEAVNKFGGVLVILYVNHRGSSRIQDLYSTEIYCVNRQPQLKTLETRNRFISTYDQLNDRQKDALKQAFREALN